jgi:hypothetical protein
MASCDRVRGEPITLSARIRPLMRTQVLEF